MLQASLVLTQILTGKHDLNPAWRGSIQTVNIVGDEETSWVLKLGATSIKLFT